MIQMKLSILRHGSSTRRTVGGIIGLVMAILTVLTSVLAPLPAVTSLLAALMAAWFVGWVLGPSGVGGGDQSLRPEYFALEPVPLRKVTLGLLASSFVGVTVPVTAVAFLSLLTLAIRFGVLAALVAVIAVPVQVVFFVLASRVVTALSGAALRTRVGVEVTAIQNAALLAAGFSIYMLYQAVSQYTDVFDLLWNKGVPYDTVLLALPSGWGVYAVTAAGQGDVLHSLGALTALVLASAGLMAGWTALIRKRVTSPTTTPARHGRGLTGLLQRFLPSGPVGAVIGRELRTWGQDPRRALELRTALWTGVLICALGLLVGLTFMIPLAGLITIALAALMSLNVYALDGTALWQTILTPNAERHDVRGRQIAWLMVFVPIAVLVSVGGVLLTGQDWAWPWVLAILPALIGGGVGFSILFSVAWPAPGPEPHRHGGNPLDSGDVVGQFNVMFPLMLLTAAPPAAVTAVGFFLYQPGLMWSGVAVGVLEGLLLGWGLGRISYRRLEKRGPELLNTLRWGWNASAGATVEREDEDGGESEEDQEWALFSRVGQNLDTMSSGTGVLMTVLGLTFWLPLYQGAMSLVALAVGVTGRSWHLPLYLPEPWQLPAALGMLLLGVLMVAAVIRILFRVPEGGAAQGDGGRSEGGEAVGPADRSASDDRADTSA
jgi:ABC-2 type transport system permease protein